MNVWDAIARGKRAKTKLKEMSPLKVKDAADRVLVAALPQIEHNAEHGYKHAVLPPCNSVVMKEVRARLKEEGVRHHVEVDQGQARVVIEWE